MAASTPSSVPGVRAARQSGRRLNVLWDSVQGVASVGVVTGGRAAAAGMARAGKAN